MLDVSELSQVRTVLDTVSSELDDLRVQIQRSSMPVILEQLKAYREAVVAADRVLSEILEE